jgi:hypothetical protein
VGHSAAISSSDRAFGLAAALASALLLGGCGGVELQGKVFDYMGLSGDGTKADPRMSERAPLVVPPNLKTLPAPGTGPAVATARPDWPVDPEREQKRAVDEKAAAEAKAEAEADPSNPYAGKPTLLDRVFGKEKAEEAPIADVPEPDPADKTPKESASQSSVASGGPRSLTPGATDQPTPAQDPFHPSAPDSYKGMSNPAGNSANY